MTSRAIRTVVSVACVVAAARPGRAAIVFQTTIRDFTPATNPDFESYLGDDRGIVATTLGADGEPTYAGGTHPSVHSAATFDQWYHDVPGVNLTIPATITLTESSPGVFQYANPAYFPIDGQGFGNYGSTGHNFHFTTELHSTFTYAVGQYFTFTGDDDAFVFVNRSLVIDLGGVHSAETRTANLDALGLTPGRAYSLDLYQAERRTNQSTFTVISNVADLTPVPETGVLGVAGVAALTLARRSGRRGVQR